MRFIDGELPIGLGRLLPGALPETWLDSAPCLEVAMIGYLFLNERVNSLVGNRFYPHQNPRQNAAFPCVTYYRSGTQREHGLLGSPGYAFADIAFDVWSTKYLDTCHVAEAMRQALYGFQGIWGRYGIYSVLLEAESDNIERPADGSGTWYYSKSLDYRVMFQESIPRPSLPASDFATDTEI